MKKQLCLIVGLCFIITAINTMAESQISSNKVANPFSVTLSESWKSGRMLPTTFRLIYDKPVLESELGLEYKTEWTWPRTIRLSVFAVNPFEGGSLFAPPAGELDYMLGLSGKVIGGINVGTLVQYIDSGSLAGAKVGEFGDNDIIRFRLRIDRPFVFANGLHTVTPMLTYYHPEPYTYRANSRGEVLSPELKYDWQPYQWFKAGVNIGYLRNWGAGGGIPADIATYGLSTGVRLCPQAWINLCVQQYNTFGSPKNVPHKDFLLYSASLSMRF